MPIRSDPCRNCGTPRCAYCPVTKVRVRMTGHHVLLEIEADEEGVARIEEGAQVVASYVWLSINLVSIFHHPLTFLCGTSASGL
ncbi:hypothetical protein CGRA01v4_01454 [Colletotrichum graminicola]|nr:hypothetical protein CGRA01v4_01454 [Colletotrichum graminicola]